MTVAAYDKACAALEKVASATELDRWWRLVETSENLGRAERESLTVPRRWKMESIMGLDGGIEPQTTEQVAEFAVETASGQGVLFEPPGCRVETLRCDEAFACWYQHYPRKSARADALRKWRTMWRKGLLPELRTLLDAIRSHRASRQWSEGHHLIPFPATWLHQQRWEDEVEPRNPYAHERNAGVRDMLIQNDSYRVDEDPEALARIQQYLEWEKWIKQRLQ